VAIDDVERFWVGHVVRVMVGEGGWLVQASVRRKFFALGVASGNRAFAIGVISFGAAEGISQEETVQTRCFPQAYLFGVLSTLAILAVGSMARGTVIWNQGTQGGLSENPAAPTAFTLAAGTNSVIATVGGGSGETGINQNWVNINIPSGLQLSQYVLAAYSSTDLQGFTGVASGSTFAPGQAGVNTASNYLGYSHFGTGAQDGSQPPVNVVGQDILPLMGNNAVDSPGSQGFTPPLPAGSYTFLIQQLGATTNYQFDFDVATVPEPICGGILFSGLIAVGFSRHRRMSR
jgi:hypothetical protein